MTDHPPRLQPSPAEQRSFHRILYRAPAHLADASGRLHACEVIDLSLRGCLLQFPDHATPDTGGPCLVTIPLDQDNAIQMTLSLAHQNGRRLGFSCNHMDLASFSLLRRLVELNLDNPQQLERDLSALWGPA